MDAGRVAEVAFEVGAHGVENRGREGGGGVVIEVDHDRERGVDRARGRVRELVGGGFFRSRGEDESGEAGGIVGEGGGVGGVSEGELSGGFGEFGDGEEA